MERDHIGVRIAQRRKALGMTQRELAEQLHITDRAVSRWERGIGSPDISLLEPLAAALKMSIDELMTGNPPEPKSAPKPAGEIPEWKRRRLEEENARRARIEKNAPVLGEWLWILFWLVVPVTLSGLMTTDSSETWLYVPGEILNVLCSVAYGLILLRVSSVEARYRRAGICYLAACGVTLAAELLFSGEDSDLWKALFLTPGVVVGLASDYNECMAHAAVLEDLDMRLSEKWENLWKLEIGFTVTALAGTLLALVLPGLGLLILAVAGIGTVVVAVMKLCYIYKTAKIFREYPVDWT